MATIIKEPLNQLGYGFVASEYLSHGDEYSQRNQQWGNTKEFRQLTAVEISILLAQHNYAADWTQVWVTDKFLPELIQYVKFYGLVRIGDMESLYLNYRDLRLPCGIYHSTVISCDFGDRVAVHQVHIMSHYIVGDEVMLANINEMMTSDTAKFGNGILKAGDIEERRIKLELCNENGGRAVWPFDGMQAGDVFLWSRYRADDLLQQRFQEMTENQFSKDRGFYSTIGDRCVIKNTHTIKDVKIGTDAYIKGVNKLKNLTINSSQDAFTQIGEGCELVNGIIGYGCRIFYGVKAVRFVLSSFSQLKYGARLINSFLGDNSTISCCEVLNSLLFPAHEQHHNNSFLCASLIMGQSNMAAGATVGSNHNSRAADGELVAGRGFWPGLCVSLKHNSRFASYTLIVKGDFLHELDIKFPFCLVSNDPAQNRLVIMPAYWFMYNMYALMRNAHKFAARDRRQFKNQHIEYAILAPDTVNEMFTAMAEIASAVGRKAAGDIALEEQLAEGHKLLQEKASLPKGDLLLSNVENSKRMVVLAKPYESYQLYKRMIRYYGALQLISYLQKYTWASFKAQFDGLLLTRFEVRNIGGQLFPLQKLESLLKGIRTAEIDQWAEVHSYYHTCSEAYPLDKCMHGLASLAEVTSREFQDWDREFVEELLQEAITTKQWIFQEILQSRQKDYENPFKQMVYDSYAEMEQVVGRLADNDFIRQERQDLAAFEANVMQLITEL